MVQNLQQANKQITESKEFYRRYIRQTQEQTGNKKLCELLDISEKYLFKIVDSGTTMALYRMANKIADTMSANEGDGLSIFPLLGDVGKYVTEFIDLDSCDENKILIVYTQKDRLSDGHKNVLYKFGNIFYKIYSVSISNFAKQKIELKRVIFANLT